MYILDRNGIELNAECQIGEEDGVFGLILESWGPAQRNKDYNIALEYIIERLIESGQQQVIVYLASLPSRTNIPFIEERRIHPNTYFNLTGASPSDIRQELCRFQTHFSRTGKKSTPSASGNRSKRIMINIPSINSDEFWEQIIYGNPLILLEPTNDSYILNERVNKLLKKSLNVPKGYEIPISAERVQKVYFRDPAVKAWVLQQSKGFCEHCGKSAPFSIIGGDPYLEVHHVIPLSAAGADTISNCVALCPNCHRAFHYSESAQELVESLYLNIKRLHR
ncbi:HNH endonuclease signature motif containing protein [Kluyvera cryocrescens]|uniref:HNH endonuclease n=1 Tax=Kluyvera cryocrescens TaxID=580 RepID=UPI00224A76B1|nr:HNH endonuclease signature motif containing protein [Kluyvera cryocrescens]MCX2869474.1 HNH endonuclease signature motif containing protein [Kluyvera cryocrescens]